MRYELFAMPPDDGDMIHPKVDGFDLAQSAINIAAGTLDYMLARVGRSLDRVDGYSSLSEDAKKFVHEIMFMLMLEELGKKMHTTVQLGHGEKVKAHSAATREIKDCDIMVKVINNISDSSLDNAIIARDKEEALEVVRRHLECDKEIPKLLSWESMRIQNPFDNKA